MGIGSHVSYYCIKVLAGSLTGASDLGQSCTITVLLPRLDTGTDSDLTAPTRGVGWPQTVSSSVPSSELIVAGDLALQKQFKHAIDRFESITVGDRSSARAQLSSRQRSVAPMDLRVPPDPDFISEGVKLLAQPLELDSPGQSNRLCQERRARDVVRAGSMGACDPRAKLFEPEKLAMAGERASAG